jgi:predicted MPP superfamily phosphohydrolase
MFTGHILTAPLHHLFNRLPHWEYGLARPQLTRLHCAHARLAGRRAVHLTDLHLDRYQMRHDKTLRIVADLKPDWIFVTGDLLNVRSGLLPLFRFLAGLRWIAPLYMTLGNHDHYSGVPVDEFASLADRHKITLLVNQTTTLPVNGGELAIIGVDDPSLHRARLDQVPPPHPDRFTLLLAHAPNVVQLLHDGHHLDLILTGHSHGGQWRPPHMRPFWLPPGCGGKVGGLYEVGRHRLYVNRGLGWSALPIRWNCPPEVLLIEWTDAGQGSRAQKADVHSKVA